VNEKEPDVLEGERKDFFVHIVMQLLYLSQHACRDIRTDVSFLCGRLHRPDKDNYKKVSRVIKYLQATRHNRPTFEAKRRWDQSCTMVGGCIFCGALRYERAYRWDYVIGKWINLQHFD